jgi:hypothetical protein
MVSLSGPRIPDLLVTDTVGFIQKLPTHLVAAFRATLEEISDADILLHVTDISSTEMWLKQEAAVLRELADMGLADKPLITLWNKVDRINGDPAKKEYFKTEASRRPSTVCASAVTGEGLPDLVRVLEEVIASTLEPIAGFVAFDQVSMIHKLGIVEEISYEDEGVYLRGRIPLFLKKQFETMNRMEVTDMNADDFDWTQLGRGRHSAVNGILETSSEDSLAGDVKRAVATNDDEDDSLIVDESMLLDYDAGEFWHLEEDISRRKLKRSSKKSTSSSSRTSVDGELAP